MESFFATCPRGLEEVLCHEFQELGGQAVHPTPGGVSCQGPFSLCYRLNLQSRIASRILWKIGQGAYRQVDDLYQSAIRLPWPTWFSNHRRIKVRVIAQQSPLPSLEFAGLRVKDAICDRFVKDTNRRPSVDKHRPDVQIVVFVDHHHVLWYLDTSGEPLFKRGWRKEGGQASLRENLAAGILKLTGWTGDQVLLDPMCGSGTLLIEAALLAGGVPPGRGREFAFRHLLNFDRHAWETVREQSPRVDRSQGLSLRGFDREQKAVDAARQHGHQLGIPGLTIHKADVLDITAPSPAGILVTNPPYGVRMGDRAELTEWYPRFGDILKQRFAGWRVYIFSADSRLPKLIRLSPSRRIPLYNGPLESRLYEFRMVAGGNRKSARLLKQAENLKSDL